MVLLYSISKELSINELTFDLYWGYPSSGVDFLDGTCILYTGTESNCQLWRIFDFKNRKFNDLPHMSHSGDILDSVNKKGKEKKKIFFIIYFIKIYIYIFFKHLKRIGHHRITANLAFMPETVTKLYFVLSSFGSPDIGCFKDPSFKLYDPSDPDVQLCSYTIKSAAKSRAVIMCVVEKVRNGNWNIFEIGRVSDSHASNYTLITNVIKDINYNFKKYTVC